MTTWEMGTNILPFSALLLNLLAGQEIGIHEKEEGECSIVGAAVERPQSKKMFIVPRCFSIRLRSTCLVSRSAGLMAPGTLVRVKSWTAGCCWRRIRSS